MEAAAAAAAVGKDDKGGCGRAVGKDVRGNGELFLYGVMVKRISLCVFSILMFGKEAICPDGLFVPTIFRESGLNSLISLSVLVIFTIVKTMSRLFF